MPRGPKAPSPRPGAGLDGTLRPDLKVKRQRRARKSFDVVMVAPADDLLAGVGQRTDPVQVRAFVAEPSAWALDESVLHRLSWLDKAQLDNGLRRAVVDERCAAAKPLAHWSLEKLHRRAKVARRYRVVKRCTPCRAGVPPSGPRSGQARDGTSPSQPSVRSGCPSASSSGFGGTMLRVASDTATIMTTEAMTPQTEPMVIASQFAHSW